MNYNYSFFFLYILDLNMNEWVPVKGHMEVVSSNSMSMGNGYRYQDDLRQKFHGLTGCQRDLGNWGVTGGARSYPVIPSFLLCSFL